MPKRIATLYVALAVMGCGGSTVAPDAHFDTSEGWHDLVLPIASHSQEPNGKHVIVAAGNLSGQEIGLRILIDPSMRPGIVNDEIDRSAFFREGVVFEVIGRPTHNMVESLASAYEVAPPQGALRASIPLTVFALQGDPQQLDSQHLNFKVFHDDTEERDQYYELFLHIDLPNRRVELHEKDPEYRTTVIRGFFD